PTSVIAFPLDWQLADARALKSPASAAGVGMKLVVVGGCERLRVPWKPPKKKSLLAMTLPPTVAPNWFRLRLSCLPAKNGRAFREPLRRYSNRSPCKRFDPDLVTTLTVAPGCVPKRADRALVSTLNSCSASGN